MDRKSEAMMLFVTMVGGQFAGQRIECHDIEIYLARNEQDLVSAFRNRNRPDLKARHIDGWIALPLCGAAPHEAKPREILFLAELGQNRADSFYELHDYALIVASDTRSAIREAKAMHPGWHVDNLINLSREAEVLGERLDPRGSKDGARLVSKYIRQ